LGKKIFRKFLSKKLDALKSLFDMFKVVIHELSFQFECSRALSSCAFVHEFSGVNSFRVFDEIALTQERFRAVGAAVRFLEGNWFLELCRMKGGVR
jgi:hypothetical protein